MDGMEAKVFPERIELERSSVIVRARSLDLNERSFQSREGARMKTYRVVLRVDVNDDDICKSRGNDVLEKFKASEDDHLRAHVEHEIGWLAQSFSRVETQSVTRLREARQGLKKNKPAKTRRARH